MANEKEKLSICGLACVSVGVPAIQSFSEGTAQSEFLAVAYEPMLASELSLHPWRFATGYFDLTPNKLEATPLSRFNCAYRLPTDLKPVSIDTVLVSDEPIEYERRGYEIHTNDTANDTVILQYRFRADETEWLPYFRQLMVYRLATGVAFSVMRNNELADSMKGLADGHFLNAKRENSQSQSQRKFRLNRLKRARAGTVNKFWRYR